MQRPTSRDSKRLFILFLMFFGGLGGMLYGYDIGVIAGALLFMDKTLHLTTAEASLIVGAVLGGGAFATLFTGFVADAIGRKKTIIISALIFIVGVLILVMAHNFFTAMTGRLIQGVGIGMQIIVLPLYLAETAPPKMRGKSVTLFQLFLTIGILTAYLINILFAHNGDWRGMFLCILVPGTLLLFGAFYIVESPRWVYLHKGKEATIKILLRSRSQTEAELDVKQMELLAEKSRVSTTSIRKLIFKRNYFLPFLIAFAVACLNQLTGINSFLQFGTIILKNAGLNSNIIALLGTAGIGLMNIIVTFIAIALVDKLGRKPLLSIGTAITVVALIFLGLVTLGTKHPTTLDGYLVFAGLITFVIGYAIGPGVVVWLAISELMPTKIRSVGMSVCLFANSAVSAVLASVFLVLVEKIHISGVFFLCGGCTVLYFIIAKFVLLETKNKSLEDIEQHFMKQEAN